MGERNNAKVQLKEEVEIDLMVYARKLWAARKVLLKAAGIGAVLGLIIAFSMPNQYTVSVNLAPEFTRNSNNRVASMVSMFGLGGMSMGNDADALGVMLYPDVVSSTPFLLDLFDTRVTTSDGKIDTTFVAYLGEQKAPWWGMLLSMPGKIIGGVKSLFVKKEDAGDNSLDPFHLTPEQEGKLKAMRAAITAKVDKKTGFTTVAVTLQDPLVTATVADKVIKNLQGYITAYRVSKSQQDCEYLEQLYKERQQEYYAAQQQYAAYMDANKNVNLQRARIEGERLQYDMDLAFDVYKQVAGQLQMARAKVQEAKPVFAVVEPATVPLRPSGTSNKVMLIGFAFLALVGTSAWILFGKDFVESFKHELKEQKEEAVEG